GLRGRAARGPTAARCSGGRAAPSGAARCRRSPGAARAVPAAGPGLPGPPAQLRVLQVPPVPRGQPGGHHRRRGETVGPHRPPVRGPGAALGSHRAALSRALAKRGLRLPRAGAAPGLGPGGGRAAALGTANREPLCTFPIKHLGHRLRYRLRYRQAGGGAWRGGGVASAARRAGVGVWPLPGGGGAAPARCGAFACAGGAGGRAQVRGARCPATGGGRRAACPGPAPRLPPAAPPSPFRPRRAPLTTWPGEPRPAPGPARPRARLSFPPRSACSSPVSRVVYNGKRSGGPRSPGAGSEIFTPAHEENVRFIYEAWQCVERDLRSQMGSERGLVEEYVEKMPNPSLKAFKPVDLGDLKRRSTQDAKKS
uniref:MAPK regulated corepressor interacting protein 1 n=4 Tax=Neoaves TaxID=3078114 RepID=A0A674H428_TAEGU